MNNRVFVCCLLVFSLLASVACGQLDNTPWPKPGRDERNSSTANNVDVALPFPLWPPLTDVPGSEVEGVIIDTSGNLAYQTPGDSSKLVSLNSSGILWSASDIGSWDWCGPIAANGVLYAQTARWGSYGANELASYNPATGAKNWGWSLGGANDSSPAVDSAGVIYVVASSRLIAVADLGASASVLWTAVLPGDGGVGPPAVYEDAGDVYIYLSLGFIITCVKDDGVAPGVIWQQPVGTTSHHPSVDSSANVYVAHHWDADPPNNLYSFNGFTGAVNWSTLTPTPPTMPGSWSGNHFNHPSLSADEQTLYVGGHGGAVYAYDTATGTMNWMFAEPAGRSGEFAGAISVLPNGYLYAPNHDGYVYCIKDEGASASLFWEFDTGDDVASQVAVDADGTIYFVTLNSTAYALMPWTGGEVIIITTWLEDAQLNKAYCAGQLETYDGTAPFVWSNPGGGLPPGMSLSASGTIQGTPTTKGTYTFTIRVTDSSGPPEHFDRGLTLNVVDEIAPMKPTITDMEINSSGNAVITWDSAPGNVYAISTSSGPYDYTSMTYTPQDSAICSQGTTTVWEDTSTPAAGEKYYQLKANGNAFPDAVADDIVGMMVLPMLNARNMVSNPFEAYPGDHITARYWNPAESLAGLTAINRHGNPAAHSGLYLGNPGVLDDISDSYGYWGIQVNLDPNNTGIGKDFTDCMFEVDLYFSTNPPIGTTCFWLRLYSGNWNAGTNQWDFVARRNYGCMLVPSDGTWTTFTRDIDDPDEDDPNFIESSCYMFWIEAPRWDHIVYTLGFDDLLIGKPEMGKSTLDKEINDQLTGHPVSQWASDQISAWDADAQTYTLAWLRAGQGWRAWNSMDDSPTFSLDADTGCWVTINNTPKDIKLCGRVAQANRTIPMKANRNMVGSCFPVSCLLTSSNLAGSGFTGHPVSQWASDKLEFWNAAAQTYVGVWYRAGMGWRAWDSMDNPPAPPYDEIDPGEGWWTTVNNTPFTWTYKVPPRPVED